MAHLAQIILPLCFYLDRVNAAHTPIHSSRTTPSLLSDLAPAWGQCRDLQEINPPLVGSQYWPRLDSLLLLDLWTVHRLGLWGAIPLLGERTSYLVHLSWCTAIQDA
jgi:hypothetical protein